MNGPEHYREAERLLTQADSDVSENWPTQTGEHKADMIAAAQVHAALAQVALLAEASRMPANDNRPMVQRPLRAGYGEPAFPGSAWGRVLYPLSTMDRLRGLAEQYGLDLTDGSEAAAIRELRDLDHKRAGLREYRDVVREARGVSA